MNQEYKIHIVESEEKLSTIASKYNTTPREIKVHNPELKTFGGFVGGEFVSAGQRVRIPTICSVTKVQEQKKINFNELKFIKENRYRCEQTVINKLNGVISNHAETRREFLLRYFHDKNERLFIAVDMVDNIITFYPPQLQEAMALVTELDKIKCNVQVSLFSQTGKIQDIINHKEIIEHWEEFKDTLSKKYNFLRNKTAIKSIKEFISLAESQIKNKNLLIKDLGTKLFFDLFFDKYLIEKLEPFEPYSRIFYSNLFEEVPITMNLSQDILRETPELVEARKVSKMEGKEKLLPVVESKYNEKFKPLVKYKFSDYNYSYRERYILNTEIQELKQSDVTIIEEVKNNIQLLIKYSLKKVE